MKFKTRPSSTTAIALETVFQRAVYFDQEPINAGQIWINYPMNIIHVAVNSGIPGF